ncbi:Tetrahydroberberine oxidase [Linum perenne]
MMRIINFTFAAILLLFAFPWNHVDVLALSIHENFINCLSISSAANVSKITFYTQTDPSYFSVLQFSIQNLRFNTSFIPKPLVIVTPLTTSHVQSTVLCSKKHGLHLRIRGGGHDYEGLSYVTATTQPFFILLDLINLSSVTVDVASNSAWVEGGAIIGELYYKIGTSSKTLAFPAGVCPTVGVGGHFSGGGYGVLLRKFGLAADHIIDAQLVDVEGRVLNRASMGEDLFWAIRGGGGNTFGVVIAWKVNLVPVTPTVTVFTITHTTDKNATKILDKWQRVADTLPDDLFIRVILDRSSDASTGRARFNSLFLGTPDVLLPLLRRRFPELGATREDLLELTWIQSVLYFAGYPTNSSLEVLRSRIPLEPKRNFKAKSDYVVDPIPEHALNGLWRRIIRPEIEGPEIILSPYGGRMSEIMESSIPFPHRDGNKFKIQYLIYWVKEGRDAKNRHIGWIRELYSFLAPHVSKNPRAAYLNYRDLDIGMNIGDQEEEWGVKYFKGNYKRLVAVKTVVDPMNFFRNEQSISPLYAH